MKEKKLSALFSSLSLSLFSLLFPTLPFPPSSPLAALQHAVVRPARVHLLVLHPDVDDGGLLAREGVVLGRRRRPVRRLDFLRVRSESGLRQGVLRLRSSSSSEGCCCCRDAAAGPLAVLVHAVDAHVADALRRGAVVDDWRRRRRRGRRFGRCGLGGGALFLSSFFFSSSCFCSSSCSLPLGGLLLLFFLLLADVGVLEVALGFLGGVGLRKKKKKNVRKKERKKGEEFFLFFSFEKEATTRNDSREKNKKTRSRSPLFLSFFALKRSLTIVRGRL